MLFSSLKKVKIEIQRGLDHGWRLITGQPTGFHSEITTNLFLGGQYGERGVDTLKKWGVTAVVSVRMTKIPTLLTLPEWRILHIPTPDLTAPTMKDLKQAINFISTEINNGGKVYIHCKYGEGRGPTTTIAYLLSTGLTLDDSIDLIRKVRPFIKITAVQLQRLQEVEKLFFKK